MFATLSYAKQITLTLNSHMLRHGCPDTFIDDRLAAGRGWFNATKRSRLASP
jgi:hypothetical protein